MVNKSSDKTGIIVVAAGNGTRYGDALPKQFIDLCSRPVLRHCTDTFLSTLPDAELVLVLSEQGKNWWNGYCRKSGYWPLTVCIGGKTRGESVLAGLKCLERLGLSDNDAVLIHDGARPLISSGLIERITAEMAKGANGAVPFLEMSDSMVELEENGQFVPVSRSRFRTVQTPQAFRFGQLMKAYSMPEYAGYTDDLSLMHAAGFSGQILVPGELSNIKITHPTDLAVAVSLLNRQ